MAHGGARAGAGRKTTRERYESKIQAAEKKIADRLPEIIDRMIELASGVEVQEIAKDGTARVYREPPDYRAASYLLDRIMGKPVQAQEITGKDGGPLNVNIAARKAAAEELEEWRREMTAQLSNMPNVPPTLPTSSTTTES